MATDKQHDLLDCFGISDDVLRQEITVHGEQPENFDTIARMIAWQATEIYPCPTQTRDRLRDAIVARLENFWDEHYGVGEH